jgi:hypothetical protein
MCKKFGLSVQEAWDSTDGLRLTMRGTKTGWGEAFSPKGTPSGCLACNECEEECARLQALLDEHGVRVERVPTPLLAGRDVVFCRRCGQAWLLMPRRGGPKTLMA